jgi:hypothetical protein
MGSGSLLALAALIRAALVIRVVAIALHWEEFLLLGEKTVLSPRP